MNRADRTGVTALAVFVLANMYWLDDKKIIGWVLLILAMILIILANVFDAGDKS